MVINDHSERIASCVARNAIYAGEFFLTRTRLHSQWAVGIVNGKAVSNRLE